MEGTILILPSFSSPANTLLRARTSSTVRRTLVAATASTKALFLLVLSPVNVVAGMAGLILSNNAVR